MRKRILLIGAVLSCSVLLAMKARHRPEEGRLRILSIDQVNHIGGSKDANGLLCATDAFRTRCNSPQPSITIGLGACVTRAVTSCTTEPYDSTPYNVNFCKDPGTLTCYWYAEVKCYDIYNCKVSVLNQCEKDPAVVHAKDDDDQCE